MKTSKDTFGLRILIGALLLGSFLIGLATYRAYSEDLKQEFSKKVVELLPDLDNSLAKL
ncbi:hypothetical protein FGF1_21160 [Flavobacteriaceae bacterium GF1]